MTLNKITNHMTFTRIMYSQVRATIMKFTRMAFSKMKFNKMQLIRITFRRIKNTRMTLSSVIQWNDSQQNNF